MKYRKTMSWDLGHLGSILYSMSDLLNVASYLSYFFFKQQKPHQKKNKKIRTLKRDSSKFLHHAKF